MKLIRKVMNVQKLILSLNRRFKQVWPIYLCSLSALFPLLAHAQSPESLFLESVPKRFEYIQSLAATNDSAQILLMEGYHQSLELGLDSMAYKFVQQLIDKYYFSEQYDRVLSIVSLIDTSQYRDDPSLALETSAILNFWGATKRDQGEQLEAKELFVQAVRVLKYRQTYGNYPLLESEIANNLSMAGHASYRSEGKEASKPWFSQYLTAARQADSTSWQCANAWSDYASVLEALGMIDSAVICYERADQVYRLHLPNSANDLGYVHNNLHFHYRSLGNFDKQLNAMLQSIHFFEMGAEKPHKNMITAYMNLGRCYGQLGDYELALRHLQHSVDLSRELNGPNSVQTGISLIFLGRIFLAIEEEEKSLKARERALEIIQQSVAKDAYLYQVAIGELGIFHKASGNYSLAKTYIKGQFESYLRSGYYQEIGKNRINYAGICRAMGQTDSALHFMSVAQEYESQFPRTTRAYFHAALGHAFAINQIPDSAIQQFQQALRLQFSAPEIALDDPLSNPAPERIVSRIENINILRHKANGLMTLAEKSEHPERYIQAAELTYSQIRAMILDLQHHARSTSQTLTKESLWSYEGALQLLWIKHRLSNQSAQKDSIKQAAFELMEELKSASLRKGLQYGQQLQFAGIPQEVLNQDISLSSRVQYLENEIHQAILDADGSENQDIRDRRNELFKAQVAYEDFQDQIRKDHPSFFKLRFEESGISIPKVQQEVLKDGQLMVEYFMGDSVLGVVAISPSQSTFRLQVLSVPFKDSVTRYLDLLSRPSASAPERQEIRALGNRLAEILIAPEAQAFPDFTELIVVPAGWIGLIPFQSLPSTRGKTWMLEDFPIQYANSVDLISLEKAFAFSGKQLAGFAPKYGQELEVYAETRGTFSARGPFLPLQHTQAEVAEAVSIWGGEGWYGAQATESNFKEVAKSHRILHVAAHTWLHPANPLYSCIVLDPVLESQKEDAEMEDGYLHAYEIYDLDIAADLVILSACNTGVGKIKTGEGIQSIAHAFSYAGCHALVASLWQVQDESSRFIMTQFHQALASGTPKSTALRNAQLEYLSQFPDAHPALWSSFIFMGDARPLSQPFAGWAWPLGGFAVCLMVFLSFWGLRRKK
ncbi:CHAT domain-containing tetratricopeptide repeat protein [Pontibacter sp. G13]|uniref:CHAT domain-containing protein n=1 Tax=Pontibacter sp. G13 TaxID=3074898 RepID=UPI0028898FCA|nr:CHAT domain-containing tetratricopeptide repeat protein [Pontibacter sp. G13]WNJ18992.1 CHAT domain-containing tetratricopeptide repeat protein [Pontibacter sp. G13]